MSNEVGDTIESADGDPSKQGTITEAVTISNSRDGKMFSLNLSDAISPRDDPPQALTGAEIKQIGNNGQLLVATSLSESLGLFYRNSKEVRDVIDAVHESERRR